MTAFNFGDVVLVPFPFTDQTSSKQRPAVVISANIYHGAKPDLIIMAITSQLDQRSSPLEAVVSEWRAAGLIKPSVIKPVVATIERSLIIKKLGAFVIADRDATRKIIDQIFGN